MAVDQLPGEVREFASYLNRLLSRLDQGAGWCGVFWQRDPDGMQACLEGREMPPWDVVEAVLQDLAAEYGTAVAAQQAAQVRPLHAAALAAHDARPGGRDALGDRLDVMLREQRYAAERLAELSRRLPAADTQEQADAIRLDLAWAHDDHQRATARCAELRHRMTESDRLPATGPTRAHSPHTAPNPASGPTGRPAADPAHEAPAAYGTAGRAARPAAGAYEASDGYGTARPTVGAHEAPAAYGTAEPTARPAAGVHVASGGHGAAESAGGRGDHRYEAEVPGAGASGPGPGPVGDAGDVPAPAAVPKQRKRRRGSARFAGLAEDEDTAAVAVPPDGLPAAPVPAPTGRRTPRGARFAGAAAGKGERRSEPQREPLDEAARRETVETVERLVRLRGEGRSGEAHALLVELAYWPAARIPLLAAELQRAGLTADWTTLLWEAASLPADRLVAAADALVAVGRTADGEQILRQGVARPAGEIGQAVLGLVEAGRLREVRALLDAYVRVRTPEEAVRSVAPAPQTLVPLLLAAATTVSEERHWDLVHALRVAGFTA
ncbi:hypothetical protein [Streptomyces sp. NPDC005476]|uniref:hypothetical protein n=1 Tax=Streptomyces sp. NPDC005476 TaxID=3156882 RepID=UPI003452294C